MGRDFAAGVASAIAGIATNLAIYLLFTMLRAMSPLIKWTYLSFMKYFFATLILILIAEIFADLVSAIASFGYALGLIMGRIIVSFIFGENLGIIIGVLGIIMRISSKF